MNGPIRVQTNITNHPAKWLPPVLTGLVLYSTHEHLEIDCVDESEDLCPNGHLQYGLVTIGPVALPGILFALSEFFHHHAFRYSTSGSNSITLFMQ
jgi:hypothetical protein